MKRTRSSCGSAWVLDRSSPASPFGAARAVAIISSGAGYIPGDIKVSGHPGFAGVFSTDAFQGVAGVEIVDASEGLPGDARAELVYPGTQERQAGTVTKLVLSDAYVNESEALWSGCAAGAVLTINGSAGNSSVGGGFRARLVIGGNGSASWEVLNHGSGYVSSGPVILEDPDAGPCRCGLMLTAVRALGFDGQIDGQTAIDLSDAFVLLADSDHQPAEISLTAGDGNSDVDYEAVTVLSSNASKLQVFSNSSGALLATCNRTVAPGLYTCGAGSSIELIFGLPPGMCLTAVVASGADVRVTGDNSSALQLCSDAILPFTPHRAGEDGSANEQWWERAADGSYRNASSRGYTIRASPPFSSASTFTITIPGNLTVLEEGVGVDDGVVTDIEVGEAGQTAAFSTTLLRGSSDLCRNISISPDGNVGFCDVLVTLTDSGGTRSGGLDTAKSFEAAYETSRAGG
ncbi:hypothetical protein T484DRAFT_1905266 [Baffinella frigidus]|nr:hypothetical protein T484DRAFT_1905266 [Cryptophyta sp. CCMP2293]